jgi:hypothetical protein
MSSLSVTSIASEERIQVQVPGPLPRPGAGLWNRPAAQPGGAGRHGRGQMAVASDNPQTAERLSWEQVRTNSSGLYTNIT